MKTDITMWSLFSCYIYSRTSMTPAPHLQHSNFLAVAEQAEGKWVFVVEARVDLAASKRQRGNVALKVISVLVEEQLIVFQTAPALSPAVIGQHIQVACQSEQ